MSGAPVTILITMRSHPGKLDELIEQCRTVTGIGRGEHGALSFSYSLEGDRMLAIETYADAAAYARHLELAATIVAHAEDLAEIERISIIATPDDLELLDEVITGYGATPVSAVAGFQHGSS
jgi:quinol monooxygenase YgiN